MRAFLFRYLQAEIKVVSVEESDDDGDENGEGDVDSRRTLAFDDEGNQALVETDTKGEKVINLRQISTYDPNGK